MTSPLTVLVVDDHATVREGLIRILTGADETWQVHSAPNAEAALDILAAQTFDVGIVDMSMPGMNGIELVHSLRARGLRMPLLMLSMHAEEAYALRAFKAGANGYIAKDRAAEELVAAVRRVAGGGAHVPAALTERVVLTPSGAVGVPRHVQLSDRELDILRRLAGGLGVADIAEQLGLAPKTVMHSRTRIQEKLALTSPEALTAYAAEHGLVSSGAAPCTSRSTT
ncbi:MAG: response regulator transcription factor [Betaproteobacteria bacterium]